MIWPFSKRTRKPACKDDVSGTPRISRRSTAPVDDYRAVRILYNRKNACAGVRALRGRVFLCRQAPLIPLDHCSNKAHCECRYRHLADRRTHLRRDTDNGLPFRPIDNERRERDDRRRSA